MSGKEGAAIITPETAKNMLTDHIAQAVINNSFSTKNTFHILLKANFTFVFFC
jgi:hypothetical protein